MGGKRLERTFLVLGGVLVVAIVGLIVSGIYLKWIYRPVEAQAWSDIPTVNTNISNGILGRNVHRWLGWLVALGLPIYAVIFAVAGAGAKVIVRQGLWAAAMFAMVVGLIGPAVVVASTRDNRSLRRWYLVHEAPAYILLPAVVLGLVVRPRSRSTRTTRNLTDITQ